MRTTGPNSAHQTLSSEAASVLKHSLTLARRRAHAQVTPLHVAAILLTSRSPLLRRACFHHHHPTSHPLQSRALELCFNVALNRLPATPAPLLHTQPSLSNALVAALKRAQAHQRRGCIEQHQQHQNQMLAVKVELDQLVLSILDDPSVSRVMREAGFSSTAVKNNLEDSSSSSSSVFHCYNATTTGGIYSTPNSPPDHHQPTTCSPSPSSFLKLQNYPFLFSSPSVMKPKVSSTNEVSIVLDVLMRKWKRNAVIVGDTLSLAEGVVSELMGKVERGEVPEELKGVSFIKFQFSSVPLKFMKREEVEMNVADLKRKIESFSSSCSGKVIVYAGDLKWTVDEGVSSGGFGYSPVDHLVVEIGKMVSWYERLSSVRVWLMGVASYQTYMKCQMKQPCLDVQWSLQAVSVPSTGLGLSLNANVAASTTTSVQDSRFTISQMNQSPLLENKPFSTVNEGEEVLTCCQECKSSYEKEASLKSKDPENGSPKLPYWLKPHGSPQKDDLVQLRRKYNKMCQSLHQGNNQASSSPQGYLGRNFFSSSPNWPKSSICSDLETISFAHPAVKSVQSASSLPRFRRQQSCHIEFSFSNGGSNFQSPELNLDGLKSLDDKEVKITLALGNSVYADDLPTSRNNVRSELNAVIKENVPWQSETIPLVVEALMDAETNGRDKFILIKGDDLIGKRRLAHGIAKSMFGSSELIFCMKMCKNTSSTIQNREMLQKALRSQENLVVLVEGIDYADPDFVKFLVDWSETGKLQRDCGRAIFVLTEDGNRASYNTASENMDSVIQMKLVISESTFSSGMANPDNKRKADCELPIRSKVRRSNEMEEVSSKASGNETRELRRQLSSHSLDLNMKADEDEPKSDLTLELSIEEPNPLMFLNKIKNCFVFNSHADQDELAEGMFLSKLKTSFQEANRSRNTTSFDVEEGVLEDIFRSSGLYLNSLFDQWLKDVFQTSLRIVDMEKGDKVRGIRLVLDGGKGENCAKDGGYMGTCLPKRIKVSSFIG